MTRINRIVDDAEFKTLKDIDIESVESALGDMLNDNEIGFRTYNHYVQAIDQFCKWLVPKKLAVNPLHGMKRLNAKTDIKHQRRALKPKEFACLLRSARSSNRKIQCYDGETRARIYSISYMTGLRRKELASLTSESFNLEATPPTLTVEAACSKHRKKDVLPLHPELVKMVRIWLAEIGKGEPLFPKLEKRRTWLMVKRDLERVNIPYKNEKGYADFHAAGRHTHITELFRSGASIVEARELARHSDVRMTMEYTHIGIEDQAKAVGKLAWEDLDEGQAENSTDKSWQRPGSGSLHAKGQLKTFADTETALKSFVNTQKNLGKNRGNSISKQPLSPIGTKMTRAEDTGVEPATRFRAIDFESTC